MKLTEILDLTLREILNEYCILYSAECDYIYGVTTHDVIEEMNDKYDLCDEPSIAVDSLINMEVLGELEDAQNDKEILTMENIEAIIENLGLQDNLKEKSE